MLPLHRCPTHPGEMLLEEFLKPLDASVADAAAKMGLSQSTLKAIIKGRQPTTEAVAQSFAAFTGMSAQFWIGLQANYDEWHRRRTAKI